MTFTPTVEYVPIVAETPAAAHAPAARTTLARRPTYLRVVVNAVCPLACHFCHREGDVAQPGAARGLGADELVTLILAAYDAGVRKVKFLGGEPLVRPDLPDIVRRISTTPEPMDTSIITSGVGPTGRIEALFDAGLGRVNVSIHGFGPRAFAKRTQRGELARAQRNATLEAVLRAGRPVKTNYVYTGPDDVPDLDAYLDFAAERGLLVNVLDDLSNPDLGPDDVEGAVVRLRGRPVSVWEDHDPHSLPTRRLRFADGGVVEVKHVQLGAVAPWRACGTCDVRSRCREGIHAVRLTHTGEARPCMDRPDLGFSFLTALRDGGRRAAARALTTYLDSEIP